MPEGCEGCVHEDFYPERNSDYMGGCEDCKRNRNYTDWYYSEVQE